MFLFFRSDAGYENREPAVESDLIAPIDVIELSVDVPVKIGAKAIPDIFALRLKCRNSLN
jgi:hypothetical protein